MIGEKIKKAIEESGIAIRQFAIKIGMSEQNLHKTFKRDSVETKTLQKICEALNLSYSYFLEDYVSLYDSPPQKVVHIAEDAITELIQREVQKEVAKMKEALQQSLLQGFNA